MDHSTSRHPTGSSVTDPYAGPATGPVGPSSSRPAARPRRLGPHRRLSLAVLGASLLATALICLMLASSAIGLVNGILLLIGVPVLILGAGIVLSGLHRRRGGWMSLLGWPALLAALPVLACGAMVPASVRAIPRDQVEQAVGTTTYTWPDLVEAGSGSTRTLPAVAGGEVVLDLREMPEGAQATEALSSIDLVVGAGVVRVLVPQDRPILIDARSSMGWLSTRLPQDWTLSGGSRHTEAHSPEQHDGGSILFNAEEEYTVDGSPDQTPTRAVSTVLRPAQLRSSAEGTPLSIRVRMGAGEVAVNTPGSVTWAGDASQEVWIVEYWRDETGEVHVDHTDPAVPGMTHPAISAWQAQECLAQATADSGTSTDDAEDTEDTADSGDDTDRADADPTEDYAGAGDADWRNVDELSARERESYDACVRRVLEDQASGTGSSEPTDPGESGAPASPTAPATPVPSATASPTTTS